MNTLIASKYDASLGLSLPLRHGHIEELAAFGVTPIADATIDRMRRCTLPADWKLVPSDESPLQLRVHDGQDRLRFKLFYKLGSQGGGATMQLFPRFTVSLGFDENLQWGEVYDGNELIHRTATTARADGNLDVNGYNASRQPEYAAATTWLAKRHPEHADPLAYWN
jgi:hypothetical protein